MARSTQLVILIKNISRWTAEHAVPKRTRRVCEGDYHIHIDAEIKICSDGPITVPKGLILKSCFKCRWKDTFKIYKLYFYIFVLTKMFAILEINIINS